MPLGHITGYAGVQENPALATPSEPGPGNPIGTLHYKPFGEVREADGETPTDYTYTGQREESALGLMYYYVASW